MDGPLVPLQIPTGAIGQASAPDPILAGERRQRTNGADILPAVTVAVNAIGNLDEARPVRAIKAGQVDDRLPGQPGDGSTALRWEPCQPLTQLGPTDCMSGKPGLVVEFLCDNNMGQAQGQHSVGART